MSICIKMRGDAHGTSTARGTIFVRAKNWKKTRGQLVSELLAFAIDLAACPDEKTFLNGQESHGEHGRYSLDHILLAARSANDFDPTRWERAP